MSSYCQFWCMWLVSFARFCAGPENGKSLRLKNKLKNGQATRVVYSTKYRKKYLFVVFSFFVVRFHRFVTCYNFGNNRHQSVVKEHYDPWRQFLLPSRFSSVVVQFAAFVIFQCSKWRGWVDSIEISSWSALCSFVRRASMSLFFATTDLLAERSQPSRGPYGQRMFSRTSWRWQKHWLDVLAHNGYTQFNRAEFICFPSLEAKRSYFDLAFLFPLSFRFRVVAISQSGRCNVWKL